MAGARVTLVIHRSLNQAVGQVEHVGCVGQGIWVLALDGISFEIKTWGGAVATLVVKRVGVGSEESGTRGSWVEGGG